jgi:hypothetical protein
MARAFASGFLEKKKNQIEGSPSHLQFHFIKQIETSAAKAALILRNILCG